MPAPWDHEQEVLHDLTDVGQLVKQGVEPLGRGAYLVSLVPSATLIISLIAVFTSHLYPWSPVLHQGKSVVQPGPDAVAFELKGLTAFEGALLLIAIVVGAILLRPFHISLDQILEGHWRERGRRRAVHALATERHRSRWTVANRLIDAASDSPEQTEFAEVAFYERDRAREERLRKRGSRLIEQYPANLADFMPTLLGNVLRRSETAAGERYGLDTVLVYPRLHPFIEERLDRSISNELDMIDAMATFTFVFLVLAAATAPIAVRLDGWLALPIAMSAAAGVCYRAAVLAALRYGLLTASAFDLYRFDMIKAMHLPLPRNLDAEVEQNFRLGRLLMAAEVLPQDVRRAWRYKHPAA